MTQVPRRFSLKDAGGAFAKRLGGIPARPLKIHEAVEQARLEAIRTRSPYVACVPVAIADPTTGVAKRASLLTESELWALVDLLLIVEDMGDVTDGDTLDAAESGIRKLGALYGHHILEELDAATYEN